MHFNSNCAKCCSPDETHLSAQNGSVRTTNRPVSWTDLDSLRLDLLLFPWLLTDTRPTCRVCAPDATSICNGCHNQVHSQCWTDSGRYCRKVPRAGERQRTFPGCCCWASWCWGCNRRCTPWWCLGRKSQSCSATSVQTFRSSKLIIAISIGCICLSLYLYIYI